jgi:hypothetical protein
MIDFYLQFFFLVFLFFFVFFWIDAFKYVTSYLKASLPSPQKKKKLLGFSALSLAATTVVRTF